MGSLVSPKNKLKSCGIFSTIFSRMTKYNVLDNSQTGPKMISLELIKNLKSEKNIWAFYDRYWLSTLLLPATPGQAVVSSAVTLNLGY